MKRAILFVALMAATLFTGFVVIDATAENDTNWPSFRGANANGVAEGYATPTEWSVAESRNVQWQTPIPGQGHSSPVIWGDRIFVTSAISGLEDPELKVGLYGNIDPVEDDTVHRWMLYCLDKRTGDILWERAAREGVPLVKRHTKATHANCTPATDGKRVVAFFGSEGLYCYDMDGEPLWDADFGVLDSGFYVVPTAQWGFASSPIIHGDAVIVQCDIQEGSFIAALDLNTGNELWRTPRDEVPTWSTPSIYEADGKSQIVVNGYKHIGGYDRLTGDELWRMRGGGDIPVPTPIVGDNLVYIANAHGDSAPIYAIQPDASGDISLGEGDTANDHIAWSNPRNGAYMQTPLIYGDYLFSARDNGVISCYEAATGVEQYRERLGTGRQGFTASPVAADGKLYFTSEQGEVFVVAAEPEFSLLAVNELDDISMATPAISEGAIYFRARRSLIAIAESP